MSHTPDKVGARHVTLLDKCESPRRRTVSGTTSYRPRSLLSSPRLPGNHYYPNARDGRDTIKVTITKHAWQTPPASAGSNIATNASPRP